MRWLCTLLLVFSACATAHVLAPQPPAGNCTLPPLQACDETPARHLSNETGVTIHLGRDVR